MKRFNLIISIIILAIGFSNCEGTSSATKADPETKASNGLIIDLPDSISHKKQNSAKTILPRKINTRAAASATGLEYLSVVREYAGLAEEVAESIEEMFKENQEGLNDFKKNAGGLTDIVIDTNNDDNPGQILRMKIKIATPNEMSIWDRDTGVKLFETSWTGDLLAENPVANGKAVINGAMMDANGTMLALEFDTNNEKWGHWMRVSFTGFSSAKGEAIDNLDLFAAKKDNIVILSANAYLPDMDNTADENIFINNKRNYMFTASADASSDLGVVNVAMPLSTNSTSFENLFLNESIADVYEQAVYDWLTDASQSTLKGDIESYTGESIDTISDMLTAIENSKFDNDEDVNNLRFVFNLENPMYTNADGYVSNGTDTKSGYETLIPEINKAGSEMKTALEVSSMEITFENPTMPIDADYDMTADNE